VFYDLLNSVMLVERKSDTDVAYKQNKSSVLKTREPCCREETAQRYNMYNMFFFLFVFLYTILFTTIHYGE